MRFGNSTVLQDELVAPREEGDSNEGGNSSSKRYTLEGRFSILPLFKGRLKLIIIKKIVLLKIIQLNYP